MFAGHQLDCHITLRDDFHPISDCPVAVWLYSGAACKDSVRSHFALNPLFRFGNYVTQINPQRISDTEQRAHSGISAYTIALQHAYQWLGEPGFRCEEIHRDTLTFALLRQAPDDFRADFPSVIFGHSLSLKEKIGLTWI